MEAEDHANDDKKLILNDKPLEEFRRRAEELSSLLRTAIGPSGLSVILNNSGSISITKTGVDIIRIFDQKTCPERDFIIGCVKNLDRDIGDGIKTFIIMLSSLLLHSQSYPRHYLTKQFNTLLNFLYSFTYIEEERYDYSKIIEAYYLTRFPVHTSSILTALLTELVKSNHLFYENVFQNLLIHFEAFCSVEDKSSPLDESKVAKGLCVTGHFHGKFPTCDQTVKMVVIYISEEDESSDDEINTDVKEISLSLNGLNSSNIFIITNCTLPSASMQLLSKYPLLTKAASESVRFLNSYTITNKTNTETYPEVKIFNICNSFRTDLIIDVPFYRLVLYAPSKSFSQSYVQSLKSCLKLCSYALVNKSPVVECGKFEKMLISHLIATFKHSHNVFCKGEQELLHLSCQSYLLSKKLDDLNIMNKSESVVADIIEGLCLKLSNLENDIISIILKVLNDYITKILPSDTKGFEPLRLKIDVLIRVFSTFLTIMNIDMIIKSNS